MHTLIRSLVLLWGLLCLAAASAGAADRAVDVGLGEQDSVSLTAYFSIFEDPSAALTLADVQRPEVASQFQTGQAPANALNLGYTRSAYWLRLTLRNDSAQSVARTLEVAYPLLSHLELHQPLADGRYQSTRTGLATPFSTRPYANRFFAFTVTLAAHTDQQVWIRVTSANAILVPARLWTPQAFYGHERDEYLWQAWYFGMATAMVLFNLLLFASIRERIYLQYVGFVTVMALTLAAQSGLAKQYLWPETTVWSNIALYVGYSLTMALFVAFSRSMLDTARTLPRLNRWLRVLIGVLTLTPLVFYFSFQPWVRAAALLYGASGLLMLGIGVHAALQRQRSGYFYVAAFSLTVLGGILIPLRGLGLVPANVVTLNGLQMGSALEMILLAIALADRFNQVRREKEEAQQAALAAHNSARIAEQQVIENLRSSERLLEARVGARTAELSATIDRLEKTQVELVQVEKLASLGALVAGVAHELNTPIGIVLTTASSMEASATQFKAMLKRGEIRKSTLTRFVDDTAEMTGLVARSAHRAGELIASFKQVAVDQTSELRRTFDLHLLVDDHVAAMRPSFVQVPWVVTTAIAPGIRCNSYPGPLGQVIINLIQNAATHAFSGLERGVLHISASVRADEVEMVFADDGKGMEREVLARIFEPFFTTRLGRGGSGLGLSISLNIVNGVLGGSLTATSEPGHGTRFVLRFPLTAPIQAGV